MPVVDKILDMLASALRVLVTLFLAVMVAINLFNIIWRGIFDEAFGWVFNWTLLLFVWMLLFGFFVYTRDRRDVIVDVFAKRLPGLPRRALALFGDAVGILVMLAILRAAPQLLALQTAPMDAIDLPIYVRSLPLFISSTLVLVHFVNHAVGIVTGRVEAFPDHSAAQQEGAVE